ncbi:hypothetical protein ACGFK1_26010 [Mycobacterium sp. NPDC048908]
MVEDAYPTAADGPMLVEVRLSLAWTLVVLGIGIAAVAFGGLLL